MPWDDLIITTVPLEMEAHYGRQDHMVKHQGQSRGRKGGGRCIATVSTGYSVGKARRSCLGLASLNNVGGLWAEAPASSCLAPGPRVMWGRGDIGLVEESSIKQVVEGRRAGLGGLYMRSVFQSLWNSL